MAAIAAPLFERGPLTEGVRSSGGFLLNVKLPARVDPERAHLTRFQSRAPPQLAGEVFTVNCKESDTVEQLKNAVKAASGKKPQWLRAGGSRKGVVLEDSRTLASYGLSYSMSPWEYIWADSEENQARFQEEVEQVQALITTHKDDLDKNKA